MNREILFRGKDVKENWHMGLLSHIGNAWYISNKAGMATAYEVIPSTIEQYTGLTDKNGNKIFEGDILSFLDNDGEYTNYKVVWFKNRWLIVECGTNGVDDLDMFFCENSEIIGNIYDNPELLEVSELP